MNILLYFSNVVTKPTGRDPTLGDAGSVLERALPVTASSPSSRG